MSAMCGTDDLREEWVDVCHVEHRLSALRMRSNQRCVAEITCMENRKMSAICSTDYLHGE